MRRRLHRSRAAFTLLELMVALVAGLIAIGAIYYVSSASARHFHEQQRVAHTQTALRMALEQMRRDIARAGYLATPNSMRDQRCATPPREVQAVEFLDNHQTVVLPNAANNLVEADTLRLTGNYATSDVYLVSTLQATGQGAFLQAGWHGFQRDFTQWGPTELLATGPLAARVTDAERFQAAFRTGRMVHIETMQGNHFYQRITGVTPAGTLPLVNFAPGMSVGGVCVGGLADGAMIAPLSRIEYIVLDPRDEPSLQALLQVGSDAALDRATGRTNAVLVRRELDFVTGAPIAGSTRVILEHVAEVDYEFIFDQQTAPGVVPNLQRVDGPQSANLLANLNTNPAAVPHRVRSVILRLSARTAAEESSFPFVPRASREEPLTRYDVNGDGAGRPAARVRTVETEIFLPNVASRNLRP
ncbi:MAG: prepilin-type N-terminal cleavage/methylation domain-containing protein [Myxococcales bacterium]|nr:prepilin-type N-terminal cleavage/methylation domain-containing protein [Myxococcales bacterium]